MRGRNKRQGLRLRQQVTAQPQLRVSSVRPPTSTLLARCTGETPGLSNPGGGVTPRPGQQWRLALAGGCGAQARRLLRCHGAELGVASLASAPGPTPLCHSQEQGTYPPSESAAVPGRSWAPPAAAPGWGHTPQGSGHRVRRGPAPSPLQNPQPSPRKGPPQRRGEGPERPARQLARVGAQQAADDVFKTNRKASRFATAPTPPYCLPRLSKCVPPDGPSWGCCLSF